MQDKITLRVQIESAFAYIEFPGNCRIRGSDEGDEPFLVEQEFKDKTNWRTLPPSFIDQAPAGLGSALSFFSDEAFRFYLPAYLIADIDGSLERSNPAFHLYHGLDDESRYQRINPRRYGERTWFDENRHKFAVYSVDQSAAIVAYLQFAADQDEFDRPMINQALKNYWLARADK